MMHKPLISYVITAYNFENYIADAVQCAFEQTYTPLEIILSDDCSTDHTYEIMQELASKYRGKHRIILNRNDANLGLIRHINKAYLELTNGEIIVVASGDDLSMPQRTERAWQYLSTHPRITALSFSMDAFNDEGKTLPEHSAVVDKIHMYNFDKGGNIPAPSRCFYKKVMTTFGPLNNDCPAEDECISFRSLMLGDNAFLPEHMVKYRKHQNSISNPENFHRFPLELIFKQQYDDMNKGVSLGLITEEQRDLKLKHLKIGMDVRKKYRVYFSSRKTIDLLKLITHKELSFRLRIHYIKGHLKFLFREYTRLR